eukprot:157186-Rhodomonas_salina.2
MYLSDPQVNTCLHQPRVPWSAGIDRLKLSRRHAGPLDRSMSRRAPLREEWSARWQSAVGGKAKRKQLLEAGKA